MKRLLFLILTLILCFTVFSGCGNEVPESPVDLDVTFSENLTNFPKDAPALFVRDGEERIKAWRGTRSWMVEDENGLGSGIEADSPHPLDCAESLPVIELKRKTTLTLSFEGYPTKITVKRYTADASDYDDYEVIEVSGSAIEVKAGDYIYEVIATWYGNKYSGTVYYAFKTEK